MLGKEDVLLWFKDLESYKRIEVMYELLNMCIPFEIRFLGSCIEEIGKHTYQELRGPSLFANDPERLAKDTSLQAGLTDESTRHRAVIYMSVLSARNCTCANWYYRTLFRPADPQEHVVNVLSAKDQDFSNVLSELLLFYTLGLYHPAFSYEQKTNFREALETINMKCNATNGRITNASSATGLGTTSEAAIPVVSVVRNVSSHIEANQTVVVPVKTSSVMPVETILMPPHGIPQNVPPKVQIRFPSGPPEARPFPVQSNKQTPSTLSRRDLSPPQSLLASGVGQMLPPPPISILDSVVIQAPLHLDSNLVAPGPPLPISYAPPPESMPKSIEDENHFISEEKREHSWPPSDQMAKQNGIRYIKNYYPPHEQFGNLKIEPEKPVMHCSNSTSSSSSRNQSPTETPSVTPAVTPHGPGRGLPPQQQPPPQQPPDGKPRVNGLPPPPLRLIPPATPCDQPPFSTVPSFTSFQPRYYPYRPPFPPSFHPIPHNNDMIYTYPPFFYSSVPHPPRNPNCSNCGGLGHTSLDCTSQSVEDITLTPYTLDFDSPTVPDNPPEK